MNIFKVIYPEIPDMSPIELDLADADDAGFIALLSKHYVESGLTGWSWTPIRVVRQIQHPDSLVLVGKVDDKIIATMIVQYGQQDAHLNLLAVEPIYQRTGLGSSLVRYAEHSALLENNLRMHLEVRLSNTGARAFYRTLGYQELEISRNYYHGNEAAVYLMRNLQSRSPSQMFKGTTFE